ncbi:MarR family winged helix-turn-helix transcriptional regulator [Luteipulveratus halotolerans]|uniref:MarR family winged helix-turn-helix transcriptional regulator n=1 Tax=Luteipulveratus halotolerans TaxID=1631356 RepID=UPI00067FF5B0|nr:MarR family winged helix-turn-helix transcriptional regulator [Luteipulveratus halotolerans]
MATAGRDGGGNAALEAWLAVSRPVEEATARIETALSQAHSICLTAYEISDFLAGRHGWTPLSQVCHAVGRSQPRISRLVTQMMDEGLLKRVRDEADGRAFQLRLTRKGRRVYAASSGTLAQLLAQIAAEGTPLSAQLAGVLPAGDRAS